MSITREESVTLPCSPVAPAAARRFARHVGPDGANLDMVVLLVSELVTNVVLHAHSDVEVTICDRGDRTRVEVKDSSSRMPEMRTPSVTGGRGLSLVEACAARWGIERHIDGKTVWFEVTASSDPSVRAGSPARGRRPTKASSPAAMLRSRGCDRLPTSGSPRRLRRCSGPWRRI